MTPTLTATASIFACPNLEGHTLANRDPAGSAAAVTTRYGHADGSDVAWAQWSGTDMVRSQTLPGGVTVTTTATGSTFAYPNLQGP